MSDYDHFADWVKEHRMCSEDALETTITQIDIKFVRSIMKTIKVNTSNRQENRH
jgi:hypothetical protein